MPLLRLLPASSLLVTQLSFLIINSPIMTVIQPGVDTAVHKWHAISDSKKLLQQHQKYQQNNAFLLPLPKWRNSFASDWWNCICHSNSIVQSLTFPGNVFVSQVRSNLCSQHPLDLWAVMRPGEVAVCLDIVHSVWVSDHFSSWNWMKLNIQHRHKHIYSYFLGHYSVLLKVRSISQWLAPDLNALWCDRGKSKTANLVDEWKGHLESEFRVLHRH